MYLFLVASLLYNSNPAFIFNWQNALAVLFILLFILLSNKDIIVLYIIQLSIILFFTEALWMNEIYIITKLFSLQLIVSYSVFTLERRIGSSIKDLSSLDILIITVIIGGLFLSNYGLIPNPWLFIVILSLWFGLRFILLRKCIR